MGSVKAVHFKRRKMARLEDLRPNFIDLSASEKRVLFLEYVERRQRDLDTVVTKVVKGKQERGKKVSVTSDQMEALQKLGLI